MNTAVRLHLAADYFHLSRGWDRGLEWLYWRGIYWRILAFLFRNQTSRPGPQITGM